jgi:hypothetical protein
MNSPSLIENQFVEDFAQCRTFAELAEAAKFWHERISEQHELGFAEGNLLQEWDAVYLAYRTRRTELETIQE